jgi:MFS family permease
MAAVIGRLVTGVFIDRLHRRMVSSIDFVIQAIALAAMIVFPTRHALYIACVGFGLGAGNLISLPALIVQQEFPQEHFGKVISLIVALNQFTFASGPGGLRRHPRCDRQLYRVSGAVYIPAKHRSWGCPSPASRHR